MANVGRFGYAIAKPNLKLRNAPPKYVKPTHSIPHKATVVYGNSGAWEAYEHWLATRPSGSVFIMRGPSGVGKTHTTKLIATNRRYSVTEFNASSGESAGVLATRLHEASLAGRLAGRRRLILVDEFDCLATEMQAVVLEHVRSMTDRFAPLVCTCNDFASATVRAVAGLTQHSVQMRAITHTELSEYAAHYYPTSIQQTIFTAVTSANGDIRQLDMRLRVSDAAKPDPLCNKFDLGRALITRRSPARWLDDASTNTDARMVLYLAHENYTSAVPSLAAMADAADLYSTAECMQSFSVIGALDDIVAVLGASGPSLSVTRTTHTADDPYEETITGTRGSSVSAWAMQYDAKIRWPELLRAKRTTPTTSGIQKGV